MSTLETTTEAILESISDGVFTVDMDWKITSFNRAAEEITGIPRNEAIGRFCSDVFKSSMCETACALRRTLSNGRPLIAQSGYIINSAGEKIPVSVSTAVLKNRDGAVVGGAETFRDLSEIEALRTELRCHRGIGDFLTNSSSTSNLMDLASAVADSPSTILIQGETGTGKEVLARAIHQMGPRKEEPFQAINCGALPETLLESELFGYKKGAFTGADRDKPGKLALSGRGTLFLDEIGEISQALQVKLLRVLQERSFEPLGAIKPEPLNARIIAATHRDLKEMTQKGEFRQDFFYRINVMTLSIPPLRERPDDIPLLTSHFINKQNRLQGRCVPGITSNAAEILLAHTWPGNVRELENLIERAFVLCGSNAVDLSHLPPDLQGPVESEETPSPIRRVKERSEKQMIEEALKRNGFNRLKTSEELGIHKTTLYRKMKKFNIIS